MKRNRIIRIVIRGILVVIVLLNGMGFMHAWKLTHFAPTGDKAGTIRPSKTQLVKMLFLGVDLRRPENTVRPAQPYETVRLQSNKLLETWLIRAEGARGTVVLFHGYGGEKSGLLPKATEFLKMGYSTLLVDFMGVGGSEGTQTTVGFREAEEVKTCYDYLVRQGEKNIHLFGTSMGAVAVLKAMADYRLQPASILLECPFGSMYQTVCARFRMAHVPPVPMAALLLFWGGVQNGFWAFDHNPVTYARSVRCPALLMYGEKDPKVSRGETEAIFAQLGGPKVLATYPKSGHESYLLRYRHKWVTDVSTFLNGIDPAGVHPVHVPGQAEETR